MNDLLAKLDAYLTDMLGPFGPLIAVGALGLLLICLTLPVLLKKQKDPLDRLKETARPEREEKQEGAALRQKRKGEKLDKYATFLEPKDEEEYSAIRLKLLRAGYRAKGAVQMYHFMTFALGLAGLALGAVYALLDSATGNPTTQTSIIQTLLPGFAGYMFPRYWVTRRVAEREQEITNGFPDSLDMMLVCVEAGQSLDQAIVRVSAELRSGYPALAQEYDIVANEMKAGKDKTQVLRDMSERCGVADVRSFVTVLIQSQQFGTSIAEALRIYAAEMRDKRVMRAEEAANKLPTKMTLATMMLTVPPLLLILIGPSIFDIYTTLQGQ